MTKNPERSDQTNQDETDTDIGVKDAARVPMRMCAVTRNVMPISQMLRFVKAPDGSVVVDLKRNLPGRGVWVHCKRAQVEIAIKKNAFARGLKTNTKPAPQLVDEVAALLKLRAINALKMANKSGSVITGSHAIELAIGTSMLALLHEVNAAEDGKRKLDFPFMQHNPHAVVLSCFDGDDFSLVFGASHAIHVAIMRSTAGQAFVNATHAWRSYEHDDNLRTEIQ